MLISICLVVGFGIGIVKFGVCIILWVMVVLMRFIVGVLMNVVINVLIGLLYSVFGVLICCSILFLSIVIWLFIVIVFI